MVNSLLALTLFFQDYDKNVGKLQIPVDLSKCASVNQANNVQILFHGQKLEFSFCNNDSSWPTKYIANSTDGSEALELSLGKELVATQMQGRVLDRGFGIPANYNYENGNSVGDCAKGTQAALVWTRTFTKWGIKYQMTTGYCLNP